MNMLNHVRSFLPTAWDATIDFCYYRPCRFVYNTKCNIKNRYYMLIRGWCPQDAWDIGVWFSTFAPKILRHMAKHSTGYPSDKIVNNARLMFPEIFLDAKPSAEDSPETFNESDEKDWKIIIAALADLIENSNKETCTYKNTVEVIGPISNSKKIKQFDAETGVWTTHYVYECINPTFKAWCDRESTIEECCALNRPRALKIFSELLPALWY